MRQLSYFASTISIAYVLFLAVSCMNINQQQSEILKLTAPASPFIPKENSLPEISHQGTVKDNQIIFGQNVLELRKDGGIELYSNSQKLGEIFYYFKTKFNPWVISNGALILDKSFSVDKKNGIFLLEGKIPLNESGAEGTYKQTIKLEKDSRIRIEISWAIPKGLEGDIIDSNMFIKLPCLVAGDHVAVDDKTYLAPVKQGYFFNEYKNPHKVTVCPDDMSKRLSIELDNCRHVMGWNLKDINNCVRLYPGKSSNNLSFFLDIRNSTPVRKPAPTYAGIDFEKEEAMELPDYSRDDNFIQNPSFESGLDYFRLSPKFAGTDFANGYYGKKWEHPYSIDFSEAKFGQASLKIPTVLQPAPEDFKDVRRLGLGSITSFSMPLEPGDYTFSFYAKGDTPAEQTVGAWVPSAMWLSSPYAVLTGKDGKSAGKIFKITKEWERYAFSFNVPESMPVQINLNAVSKTATGAVWIDGLKLERGKEATQFKPKPFESVLITSKEDNFFQPGEPINAKLRIITSPVQSGIVKVTVKDFFGETVFSGKYDFQSGKEGKAVIDLPFNGKFTRGIYVVKAEYNFGKGSKFYDFFRFSVMDFLENKHRLKDLFSDNYTNSYLRFTSAPAVFERFKEIGIGATTHVDDWSKNTYDFYRHYRITPIDAHMTSLYFPPDKKEGFFRIDPLRSESRSTHYRTPNPNCFPDFRLENPKGELTEDYLLRFKNKVSQTAQAHPWVKSWSLSIESNCKYPDLCGVDADDEAYKKFAKLQVAFYEGVKKGNPEALVYNGTPNNMNPENGIKVIDRLLTAIDGKIKFDYIGIHPYRGSPENPDLDSDIKSLLGVMEKHGYSDTPVYFLESMHWGTYNIPRWKIDMSRIAGENVWHYGTLSYDMGWSEKIAAAWRARSWLTALKYQDRIKTMGSGTQFSGFALDYNLTPYADQKIPNTLGRLLGDCRFKKDIRFAPYVRCYIFNDKENRPVAAVWGHHPRLDSGVVPAATATANFKDSLETIFDLMEAERAFKADANGNIQFPISSFPLFFRGKPGSLDSLANAFKNAEVISGAGISPISLSVKPSAPDKVEVSAKNLISKEFSGELISSREKTHLNIPASEAAQLNLSMPTILRNDRITKEELNLIVKSGNNSFASDLSFSSFLCSKTAKVIKIDGNDSDWADEPEIKLINRKIRDRGKDISDNDFSGWFKALWNEKGIYICVKIRDNIFTHSVFSKNSDRWNNDSLQIYFDTFCDARNRSQTGYDDNDYEYAVLPGKDGKSSEVYRRVTPEPQLTLATEAPKNDTIANDIPSAFKRSGDGYIYEVFFPAKYLLPTRLEKGYALGFSLYVNDSDDVDNNKYYLGRVKSALTLTPDDTGCHNSPHLWPVMLLWE